jgi:hypothetical protein
MIVDAVMAGLGPAIHVWFRYGSKDVDARHKAGHDAPRKCLPKQGKH